MAMDPKILKGAERAKELAQHGWEHGVIAEALLELHDPDFSVYGTNPFPSNNAHLDDVESLKYVKPKIWTDKDTLADSRGLGVFALLFGQHDRTYIDAAQRQVTTLLSHTPRYANGAISHWESVAECWGDAIYWTPPFLAYYGISQNRPELLGTAVHQCSLYREVLLHKATGLWKHVVGPEHEDLGFWATSNGWAVAGFARVYATLLHADKSGIVFPPDQLEKWKQELTALTKEIIDGVISIPKAENGLVRNYITDTTWDGECAGTALLASAVYRMAVFQPDVFGEKYVSWAQESRAAVLRHVNAETGAVAPVCNPYKPQKREPFVDSPEAHAFVVLMYTAHRDWVKHAT